MPTEPNETPQQRRTQLRRRNRGLGRALLAVGLVVLSLPLATNLTRGTDPERPEDPPPEMLRKAGLAENRGDTELAAQLYERVLELEMGEAPRDTLKAIVRAARAGLARIARAR